MSVWTFKFLLVGPILPAFSFLHVTLQSSTRYWLLSMCQCLTNYSPFKHFYQLPEISDYVCVYILCGSRLDERAWLVVMLFLYLEMFSRAETHWIFIGFFHCSYAPAITPNLKSEMYGMVSDSVGPFICYSIK